MITVLFQNEDIIVCIKPGGIISEDNKSGNCLPGLLIEQESLNELFTVHRLDKETSGVMLYCKNKKSAARFSEMISQSKMKKEYLAIVHSKPENDEGVFSDFLFKDKNTGKSYVVKRERKGVKKAELYYTLLGTAEKDGQLFSLVKIKLKTGRTHQIRVQFSSRNMPVLGDRRYGSGINCGMALWSYSLSFPSQKENETQCFKKLPDYSTEPWDLFYENLKCL
ncbi:MAG: RluA family pseudouridine synthase [Clostridiales bacterium]|nr:RluA family pseudouridine synthase [Clostridiales bacterium]